MVYTIYIYVYIIILSSYYLTNNYDLPYYPSVIYREYACVCYICIFINVCFYLSKTLAALENFRNFIAKLLCESVSSIRIRILLYYYYSHYYSLSFKAV